jgi:RHS repeat-associated protein
LAQQVHIEEAEPNEPNDTYFYIHDRLGSVRLVVDALGDVLNSYTYDPAGLAFPEETYEAVYNPFLFTGQWFDPEIQQYYLRARMYDPRLGVFTSRDPVLGKFQEPMTLHTYLYCVNNPINRLDPSGRLSAWNIAGALTAGTAVHTFAIFAVAYGANHDSDRWINIGLQAEHYVAPAIGVGAALGPALPYCGELVIDATAVMWHYTTTAATYTSGYVAYAAKEMTLWALANPWTVTANAVDAMAVFCESPHPPTTYAGGLALLIKQIVESD